MPSLLFSLGAVLMNTQVASYYRAVLFADGQDSRALPKSLMRLHTFAEKRHQALGLGSTIAKATALAISLTWLSSTKEGREFANENTNIGDLFVADEPDEELTESGESTDGFPDPPPSGKIDWSKVSEGTPVVIYDKDSTLQGTFVKRRHSWIDVKVNGADRHFPMNQVRLGQAQLAGV